MINIAGKECTESPMEGAVLCCTSISPEDRAQLAEYAQEMGAKHTLDLTSDVTHLLVGSTNSEKYQYVAKNREDVKVLLPEWVHAIRRMWMADEVIDLNAMDAEYKCPTLYGLKICITGFEDLDFRNELARNIAKHGGQYTGDLTKDVTHLIAFTPQGKKFEYAGAWGVKIVSLKWYKDTLDRGMQLDELLYHPAMSPEDQGNGAWNRLPPGSSRLGKRQRSEPIAQEPSRKLRRAASARFGSQNHDMWNDIVGGGSTTGTNDKMKKIHTARSAQDLRNEASLPADPELNSAQPPRVEESIRVSNADHQTNQGGFLANKHFAQKGFDEPKKALLFAALAGHGAVLYDGISDLLQGVDDDHNSHFVIVPHDIPTKKFVPIQKSLHNTAIVTELWLEYCMTVKKFVPPGTYALASPICPTEISGIKKLSVNASGFHQVQTMHIAKTIKKLGALYQENFTPQTSVLIINSSNPNQQKIIHATAWKVPVVTEKWLWKLIATNRIPSFDHFAVPNSKQQDEPGQSETTRAVTDMAIGQREGEPDNDDFFVEAAKAIEARERQSRQGQPQNEEDIRQQRPSRDREPQHQTVVEMQISRESPLPLQEMSANIMSRVVKSAKKKLFRQFDGVHGDQIETPQAFVDAGEPLEALSKGPAIANVDDYEDMPIMFDDDGHQQTTTYVAPISLATKHQNSGDLLKDFFEVKAAAEARKSSMASNDNKPKRKKNLLGRAISNLSNSSRKSTEDNADGSRIKQPLSRASSINSVNTDGLGVPLSALSRIPSELIADNTTSKRQGARSTSLTGNISKHLTRAATDSSLANPHATNSITADTDTSFHAALATLSTSQLPHPPSPTQRPQLTYAATDEAAKLRAHLAEKRRNRARLGQSDADPAPEMTREEKERRAIELAREESEEMRQARWREEREREKGAGGIGLIKDDERVVGVGRRTRGREKRVSAIGGAGGEFGELGEGNGVFEGM